MIKVIVFDFDGVLVDSNRIKFDFFFELFPVFDHAARAALKETLIFMRERSRFDILRDIFSRLGVSGDKKENKVVEYALKYDEKVRSAITKIGLVPYAHNTISRLSSQYRIYINSATPESSLLKTVAVLEIRDFFKEIYGGPATKEENLKKIMEAENVKGNETVVIGDGESDRRSAEACDCFFIGIPNAFNKWNGSGMHTARDVRECEIILSSFNKY